MIFARIQLVFLALAPVACQGLFEDRPPDDPCDGVDCSDHGECVLVDEGSRAACVCDDDFEDDELECVPVVADGDADSDADTDSDVDTDGDVDLDDERCIPDCLERECGTDSCGGTCPPGCLVGQTCDDEDGQCSCIPNCRFRECGADGCGGSCPPGCPLGRWCDDGVCSVLCGENVGFGNACSGVETCDDGNPCESLMGLESFGAICLAYCSTDADCPDIAPGPEQCLMSFCLVQCDTASDCSCGLECRDSPVGPYCYP